ncbi:hypothetical protein N7520_004538 [Penicillium odoratum]|uniref:uncharacterized protein n=1 Tax=Penicillium odoratum TaxID=1167516 RepID=UPI0025484FC4|nr:uncharacterized protein N7520_004538 [Penicillium odoratum]KAJ5764979.1 hypothetical protein N7520_004538 [Penicillium odoratum]
MTGLLMASKSRFSGAGQRPLPDLTQGQNADASGTARGCVISRHWEGDKVDQWAGTNAKRPDVPAGGPGSRRFDRIGLVGLSDL